MHGEKYGLYPKSNGKPLEGLGKWGTRSNLFFILFFIYLLFIYLFLAALGLHCCTRAFSSCGEWGLLIAVRGLLIVVASLVVEHRL